MLFLIFCAGGGGGGWRGLEVNDEGPNELLVKKVGAKLEIKGMYLLSGSSNAPARAKAGENLLHGTARQTGAGAWRIVSSKR